MGQVGVVALYASDLKSLTPRGVDDKCVRNKVGDGHLNNLKSLSIRICRF